MNYAELTDDELLTEVNNQRGYYSVDFNDNIATELLESTGADYVVRKKNNVYYVAFLGYEATADTLPRAACVAWLMWVGA